MMYVEVISYVLFIVFPFLIFSIIRVVTGKSNFLWYLLFNIIELGALSFLSFKLFERMTKRWIDQEGFYDFAGSMTISINIPFAIIMSLVAYLLSLAAVKYLPKKYHFFYNTFCKEGDVLEN